MNIRYIAGVAALIGGGGIVAAAMAAATATAGSEVRIGRVLTSTMALPPGINPLSATYTPSGKVLVSYASERDADPRTLRLAIADDDGRNLKPFFAQRLPDRPKDNGIRFMVFPDNKRIFLGDFVVDCLPSLDACSQARLLPVAYPAEIAGGDHVAHRWSEIVVAPDNRHVSWTTLLANYSAIVFVGELVRAGAGYRIVSPRIVSTLNGFRPDPAHPDGVIPEAVRGGEVKQFVRGGGALSLAGAVRRDTPDSVVQDLAGGRVEAISDTPGYTETTIFSPDERLGLTMTTRFSPRTDPAVLGLLPRPYAVALNMGLSMFAYTYAVTGVRLDRPGNVGPALIDIEASRTQPGYLGRNLATSADWVFRSPMSWHPSGRSGMWIEGRRGSDAQRIRIVRLPDYRAAAAVPVVQTPIDGAYGTSDMSEVARYARTSRTIDVKVYGRVSGHIAYRRDGRGVTSKTYVGFSDDGVSTWSGYERLEARPAADSRYVAQVTKTGPMPGRMDLRITFGPLGGAKPARIVFDADATGKPATYGYAEYGGRRLDVASLLP